MTSTVTSTPVRYAIDDGIGTITLDDGKVNVMSLTMIGAINDALDRAQADDAVVVLTGREGVFSAGFDLAALRGGAFGSATMVRAGFELAARVLGFPQPVIAACTGHAIAMGAFLLCSADHRVGAAGEFRFAANEVAIGLTVPYAAIAILRARLTPSAFQRAVTLSEPFTTADAVAAGFLDRVVPAPDLPAVARDAATAASKLDRHRHAATKRRLRESMLDDVRRRIADEFDSYRPQ
ncbi:MAG: crotonase/enoyl-CoA hydratase family protein [Actinobacteria bacterium]|nr:crotonase/enoyl-CoA hydratase family protein [Actinomycetota bacterium]